ncbi:hypothetical protein [Hahella sp. NBU794]|uniref:hypothetical protein n=1 Tax=Hahella sp. NBU794 TaxID=3422590 RepID=UPI003D6FC398
MLEKIDSQTLDALLGRVRTCAQDMMEDFGDEVRELVADAGNERSGAIQAEECISNCWDIYVCGEIQNWVDEAMEVREGDEESEYLDSLHEEVQEHFTKSCYEALGMMHLYY